MGPTASRSCSAPRRCWAACWRPRCGPAFIRWTGRPSTRVSHRRGRNPARRRCWRTLVSRVLKRRLRACLRSGPMGRSTGSSRGGRAAYSLSRSAPPWMSTSWRRPLRLSDSVGNNRYGVGLGGRTFDRPVCGCRHRGAGDQDCGHIRPDGTDRACISRACRLPYATGIRRSSDSVRTQCWCQRGCPSRA